MIYLFGFVGIILGAIFIAARKSLFQPRYSVTAHRPELEGVQGEEEETVISHFDRWSLAPPPSILPRITEPIGTSFSN